MVLFLEPLVRIASTGDPNQFFEECSKASFQWHEATAKVFQQQEADHNPANSANRVESKARTLVSNADTTEWKPACTERKGNLRCFLAYLRKVIEAHALHTDDTSQEPAEMACYSNPSLYGSVLRAVPALDIYSDTMA